MNLRPTGRYKWSDYESGHDIAYPQSWFLVFDNTPNPFGSYGLGAVNPQPDATDGFGAQYGWTLSFACMANEFWCSPDTGGGVVRLMYIGE
jgi:hypothetical protein